MRRSIAVLGVTGFSVLTACGSNSDSGSGNGSAADASATGGSTFGGDGASAAGGSTGAGGSATGPGGSAGSTGGGATGTGGSASGAPTYEDVQQMIDAYKAAHPGNGGKDWDINAKTAADIAADPEAAALLALCGDNQRPVIPALAWEYGGSDHPWINPEQSALVLCVYVPVNPGTDHWSYDAAADHVTADVYVLFPEQNPCKDGVGADQVLGCLGDPTNIEILVDTASLNDGAGAQLSLANASTELRLVQPDGQRIHLADG